MHPASQLAKPELRYAKAGSFPFRDTCKTRIIQVPSASRTAKATNMPMMRQMLSPRKTILVSIAPTTVLRTAGLKGNWQSDWSGFEQNSEPKNDQSALNIRKQVPKCQHSDQPNRIMGNSEVAFATPIFYDLPPLPAPQIAKNVRATIAQSSWRTINGFDSTARNNHNSRRRGRVLVPEDQRRTGAHARGH